MNEEEVLVGRIQDLAEQCYHRDVPSHTEFLTLAEQDLFYRTVNKIPGVRCCPADTRRQSGKRRCFCHPMQRTVMRRCFRSQSCASAR